MTGIDEVSRQLGRHEASIERVQIDVAEVRVDVKQVLAILAERRGERKTVAKLAAALGLAGGTLASLVFRLILHR